MERTFYLREHLILPPPAQSYRQQVVHHGGRLQADDPIVVVLGNPAQDRIAISLKEGRTSADVEANAARAS